MKFLRAVPIIFFATSGLVSAAPVPFPRADLDAREPIAPLIGIAAGLLPSIFSGLKGLFSRDHEDNLLEELASIALLNQRQPAARRSLEDDVDSALEAAVLEGISKLATRDVSTDELVEELEAIALLGKSGLAGRSVEDLDARRIVLPNLGELAGILGRVAKGLFGRDVDTNDLVKELELLQALASRQTSSDVAARDIEDINAREPIAPLIGIAAGLLPSIFSGLKSLFGRDVDTNDLVKELELLQALASRHVSSDVAARAIEDINAREPIAPLIGIAAGLLPSIFSGLKSLFGRDVDTNEFVKELELLQALSSRQASSNVAARAIEDINAREPIAPLIGIAAGLLPSLFSGLKSLFGRDVASNNELVNDLAALGALLNQRSDLAARSEADVKQLADFLDSVSQLGSLQARDPRIFPNNFGEVIKTVGGALLRAFTGSR
jgi:hypothetical protein